MAETTITPQTCALAGLDVVLAAANADGSKFANPTDERTFLLVENTNGATRNVVIETQATSVNVAGYGAQALVDKTVTVPATTGKTLIGPFPPGQFNDASGDVHITFSAVSGVTIAAVRLTRV